jgi:hypothetical protein
MLAAKPDTAHDHFRIPCLHDDHPCHPRALHEQVLGMPMGPTMSLSDAVPLIEAARACA